MGFNDFFLLAWFCELLVCVCVFLCLAFFGFRPLKDFVPRIFSNIF